jgi:hypothetical protein
MRRPARLSSTSANATSTVWRYDATDSSSAPSLRVTLARLRPPSISGATAARPAATSGCVHRNTSGKAPATPPPSALMFSAGNMAARATPMRAFDASIARWAAAMSGRRSSSADGRPAGNRRQQQGVFRSGLAPAVKLAAGLPSRTASACSVVVRWRCRPIASARVVASSVLARDRSNSPMSPRSKRRWLTFTFSSRRSHGRASGRQFGVGGAQAEVGLRHVGLQRQQHRAVGRLDAAASPRAAATLDDTRPNRSTS